MDKKGQDWQQEVAYLEKTKSIIDKKIGKLNGDIALSKKAVEELRQYYVDGTQIFGELDDAEKVSVNQVINENIELANNNIDKVNALSKNKGRPYFGRVDFTSKKSGKVQAYIGLTSIEDDNDYYVIDWRAPIAELFYEHGLGNSSFRTPDGKVEGEITLKRQYDIQHGELLDAFDVDGEMFDEYLQKVLANINSEKLHNIAGTIQKEQNEIIRNLKDDLIVVQGYSGSGKTTVALHRIAYALYRLKDLKSANILLFTLNEAFVSHIEGILPELGEQNTRSATLALFASRLLKIVKDFEQNDEFLARFLNSTAQEQANIKAKLDFSIKDKVKAWTTNFVNTRQAKNGFKIENKAITADNLNKMFNSLVDLPLLTKLNTIADVISKKLNVYKFAFARKAILEKVYQCFDTPLGIWDIYKQFCLDNDLVLEESEQVYQEDAILMCLIKEQVSQMAIKMDIKHIVIDEVQEYPLLFIDFLLRIFPRAQFSMFGDKHQQTNPMGIDDLQRIIDLDAIFGTSKLYTLDNTYRSSEEIVEYASKLIGSPRHNIFRYSNNEPVEEAELGGNVTQIVSQIALILEKVINKGTIGIITGSSVTALAYYEKLSKICPHKLSLVNSASSIASEQIQILPVSLCKGLEYNTVLIINDGGMFDSILGSNLNYIATTRAINKLYVLRRK